MTTKEGNADKHFGVGYAYNQLSYFFKTIECLLRTASHFKNKQATLK